MITRTKKIFTGQPFRVRLDVNPYEDGLTAVELAAATGKQLQYKKPSGDWVTVTATQEAGTTILYYDISSATNDTLGTWSFRALLTFTGDTGTVPGTTATQEVIAR